MAQKPKMPPQEALAKIRESMAPAEGAKPAAEQPAEAPVAEAESIASSAPEAPAKPKRATKRPKAAEGLVATDDAQPTEPKKARVPRKPRSKAAKPAHDAAAAEPEAATAPAPVATPEPQPTAPVVEAEPAETPMVTAQPTVIESPAPKAEAVVNEEPKVLTPRQQLEATYRVAETKARHMGLTVEPIDLGAISDDDVRLKTDFLAQEIRTATKIRDNEERQKVYLQRLEKGVEYVRNTMHRAAIARSAHTGITSTSPEDRLPEPPNEKVLGVLLGVPMEKHHREAIRELIRVIKSGRLVVGYTVVDTFRPLFDAATDMLDELRFGKNPVYNPETGDGLPFARYIVWVIQRGAQAYRAPRPNRNAPIDLDPGIDLDDICGHEYWPDRPSRFVRRHMTTTDFARSIFLPVPKTDPRRKDTLVVFVGIIPAPGLPAVKFSRQLVIDKCGNIFSFLENQAEERDRKRQAALKAAEDARRAKEKHFYLVNQLREKLAQAAELGIQLNNLGDLVALSDEQLRNELATVGKQVKDIERIREAQERARLAAERAEAEQLRAREANIESRAIALAKASLIDDDDAPLSLEQARVLARQEIEQAEAAAELRTRQEADARARSARLVRDRQRLAKLKGQLKDLNERRYKVGKHTLRFEDVINETNLDASEERMQEHLEDLERAEAAKQRAIAVSKAGAPSATRPN